MFLSKSCINLFFMLFSEAEPTWKNISQNKPQINRNSVVHANILVCALNTLFQLLFIYIFSWTHNKNSKQYGLTYLVCNKCFSFNTLQVRKLKDELAEKQVFTVLSTGKQNAAMEELTVLVLTNSTISSVMPPAQSASIHSSYTLPHVSMLPSFSEVLQRPLCLHSYQRYASSASQNAIALQGFPLSLLLQIF